MADIKFYYYGVEDATITATGGGSTTNLRDRNPNHKWTSGSVASGQSVVIDFGSARTCDSCVVDGINWSDIVDGTTTIDLEYSSNGTTWTFAGRFSNSNTKQALAITSISRRYWRIYFAIVSTNFLTNPTIGNIILGEVLTMTNVPYNASFSFGKQFGTNKVRTIDGTLYTSQIFGGSNKWFIQFTNFSDAIRTNLLNLFSTIRGNLYPFYFADADASLNLVVLNNDLNTIEKKAYGINDTIELELETTQII